MTTTQVRTRGANVILIPPPMFYVVPFVAGLRFNQALPLGIGGRPVTTAAGAVVLIAGLGLTLSGVAAVVRHRTTIVPHHRVSRLLTGGPYRISRNPMYAGLALAYLGGAVAAGSWWPLFALPVVLVVVRRLVIDPEERYLTAEFGPAYLAYQGRVRRWL